MMDIRGAKGSYCICLIERHDIFISLVQKIDMVTNQNQPLLNAQR